MRETQHKVVLMLDEELKYLYGDLMLVCRIEMAGMREHTRLEDDGEVWQGREKLTVSDEGSESRTASLYSLLAGIRFVSEARANTASRSNT